MKTKSWKPQEADNGVNESRSDPQEDSSKEEKVLIEAEEETVRVAQREVKYSSNL